MKAELTPTQKKKKYKRISRACFLGEFASVFTPFIIMGAVNFEEYFVQYNGTKVSIAFILALSVMGLATFLIAKKKFDNTFVTLIIGWTTMTIVFFLLGHLITDIAYIMLYGLFGILGACGLDMGSKYAQKKADEIQKGIDKAKEEMTAEDYKEEVKRIKVKVKK